MRVYYNRHHQVTGYSTSAVVPFGRVILRFFFTLAVLLWPFGVFHGWSRWVWGSLWLALCAAGYWAVHRSGGAGPVVTSAQQNPNRPCTSGPRDWTPAG